MHDIQFSNQLTFVKYTLILSGKFREAEAPILNDLLCKKNKKNIPNYHRQKLRQVTYYGACRFIFFFYKNTEQLSEISVYRVVSYW